MSETLQRQNSSVPAFIKQGSRGAESIDTKEIRPPSLRLAQAMSPEAKRADPKYIEGLREGDLFNSITQEIYGDAPVHFLIVRYLGHRNVEFDPQDRNVVLDGNVPDGDPRTDFRIEKDDNGKPVRKRPIATTFKDFLILLLRDGSDPSLMTLTLKGSQLKKVTPLLTRLKLSKLDTFAHLIKGTPVPERKGNNSWYGWRFDFAGYPTEEQYFKAEKLYEKFKDIAVEVQDETEGESEQLADDIPF